MDVEAICTVEGIEGNSFLEGQINLLVDPLPYVERVENITATEGGTDLEDDRSLAERTFLAPSGYSTAGPQDAYTYWAKTYNTDIGSVRPTTPEPGKVVVYILMQDGSLPGPEVTGGLQEFYQNRNIRPMTDLVTVKAPTAHTFNLDLDYYIDRSNQAQAAAIQGKVEKAIDDYITWQTTEIGKDINPDELRRRMREAGAKRVEIVSPIFTRVADTSIAQLGERKEARYGGLEDD